jgi:hypothetical protein
MLEGIIRKALGHWSEAMISVAEGNKSVMVRLFFVLFKPKIELSSIWQIFWVY